jgi:hypothetical protein
LQEFANVLEDQRKMTRWVFHNACQPLGVLVLAVALLPSADRAQATPAAGLPATTFAEIASRPNVKTGASLVVTDSSGQRIRGKLASLSSDTLSIRAGRRTRTYTSLQVREVQQRLGDSKIEGALIGLAAGWLVPSVVCTTRSDSSETLGCVLDTLLLGGLPGLAIGAAIDAAQAKTVTIFRTSASTRLALTPILTTRSIGVRASIRFDP